MKSIRLSLIMYFLLLLGAALGGVSWFVYNSTSQTLRKSEESKTGLLNSEHEKRVKNADKQLDDRLLRYAESVATESHWLGEHYETFTGLLVLSSALLPLAHLQTPPPWVLDTKIGGRMAFDSRRLLLFEMAETVLPPAQDGQPLYVYQVTAPTLRPDGRLIERLVERSPALGEERLPLIGPGPPSDLYKDRWDSVKLSKGVRVRMVTIKRKVSLRPALLPEPFPRRVEPGRFGKGQTAARRNANFGTLGRLAYIQIAVTTAHHDAVLAGYQAELVEGLSKVKADSDATLASLRGRLLWISLISFVALAAGGFWLVRLGLAPLERVSEAVGRVSEKNFRLQVDDERLPRELQPIVGGLKRTLGLLQRAFQREKQAAADISHELRTPLAALLTTLDVGLRKPRSADEYREMLQECRAAGQQMNQIIERLLALARLDAGVDNLRPRDVDAAALAEECAALVRPLAEARDVSLRVHHNGPAPLCTDPEKLREILSNLLHNAIQYNRPHGAIDVAVQRDNGDVDLEVRDTGIGIAADAKAQIFERFYRADPSRHADDLHAGLGLAIVKGYVDLMGGTIVVDSTVGEGSRFRVRLPTEPGKMMSDKGSKVTR
jgi:heavy metal sensor kinase